MLALFYVYFIFRWNVFTHLFYILYKRVCEAPVNKRRSANRNATVFERYIYSFFE